MTEKFLSLDENRCEKVISNVVKDMIESSEYDLSLEDFLFNKEIREILNTMKNDLMNIKYKVVM